MITDPLLRDIADAWHGCVLLGLTSPTAALTTDAIAAVLALAALTAGHLRPAATLAATTTATAVIAAHLH